MKMNDYPNWLVPIKIAKKLKKIGFNTNTFFLYNEEDEPKVMFGLNTFEEVDGQSNLEIEQLYLYQEADMESYECVLPTWEQAIEWFRNRGFYITLENHQDSTKFMFYNMKINEGKHFKGEFSSYKETREVLVNKLIEVYGNNI